MLENLCAPAQLYVAFSITQIIIDIFKNMHNTAFFKFMIMIIFTIMLNVLCKRGLGIVSWMIVFLPFIMMTIITTLLLFTFGLSPENGKLNYSTKYPVSLNSSNKTNDESKNMKESYENERYNPNDFRSGTPEEINHYNNK
jgi:hypothetical protein